MADDQPVLEVRGITKTFPGVVANADINFTLNQGEIHCLLGENGAGKSTLMNIVFGLYQPDPGGQIFVSGREVQFESSADAIAQGIGMVHQNFQLIPVLSVAENVMLGDELTRGPFLDIRRVSARIKELSDAYGLRVDPEAMVGDLSVGQQQRVELIKALYRETDILILDEPTAVLTPGEVDDFFRVVDTLVNRGNSIVFITHKLREVLAVADQITVLRGGRVVGTADPKTSTQASLASLMVGRDVGFEVEKDEARPGEIALSVSNLVVQDDRKVTTVNGFSLDVRKGEIFGIAGVEGNGQRELVESLTGMRPAHSGSVRLGERDITNAKPRAIADLGVGHIPEDREKHGSIGSLSIADNLVINRYHKPPFSRGFLRNDAAILENAERLIEQFDIRTPGPSVPIDTLSGGNRQKCIVARELSGDLELLVTAQPTRGLDVGSIEFIHEQIIKIRDEGAGVLLVSAELDEILSLSDRIGVMYRGQLLAIVDRADATREGLGLLMAGGQSHDGAAA